MLTVPKNRRTKEREKMRDERFIFFEKKFESIVESIGAIEEEIRKLKLDNDVKKCNESIESINRIDEKIQNITESKADITTKDNGPIIKDESDMEFVVPMDSITPEILQEASAEDLTSEVLAEPENLKIKDIKEDTTDEDLVEDTNE